MPSLLVPDLLLEAHVVENEGALWRLFFEKVSLRLSFYSKIAN
jgi:hypothetical protein